MESFRFTRRAATAAATALACAALVSAAHAQLEPVQQQLGLVAEGGLVDTDVTPKPKVNAELWKLEAGAKFGETQTISDATNGDVGFDVDFYDLAFRDKRDGFAVGSACKDAPERGAGESDATYGTRVSSCERVPVIYRSPNPDAEATPRWKEVHRGDELGYVGAVSWIGETGRALAVGGTGSFPRRERAGCNALTDTDENQCDEAGEGRVWLFDGDSWRELKQKLDGSPGDELPDGMRGLSALAFHQQVEFGIAGALGQLWHWEGDEKSGVSGRFVRFLDHTGFHALPGDEPIPLTAASPERFIYRVREVRIAERKTRKQAVAVTSGCCSDRNGTRVKNPSVSGTVLLPTNATVPLEQEAELDGVPDSDPRYLVYDERGKLIPQGGGSQPFESDEVIGRHWSAKTYTAGTTQDTGQTTELRPLNGVIKTDLNPAIEPPRLRRDAPDGLYSLSMLAAPAKGNLALSFLATPSAPAGSNPAPERSLVTQRLCLGRDGAPFVHVNSNQARDLSNSPSLALDPAFTATRISLTSARLVAADGDEGKSSPLGPGPGAGMGLVGGGYGSTQSGDSTSASPGTLSADGVSSDQICSAPAEGDAIPDWLAGELRSTALPGLGARGLAVATHLRPYLFPDTIRFREEHNMSGCTRLLLGFTTDITCDVHTAPPDPVELASGYRPTDQARLARYLEARHFLLPSYAVNAIDVVGQGVGYAAGDRGAILRLDEGTGGVAPAGGQSEGTAPRLGSRSPVPLPDTAAYSASRPSRAAFAGAVPPLALRPRVKLAEPELVPMGSPHPTISPTGAERRQLASFGFGNGNGSCMGSEDVRQIVLGRDGREGWAIGPTASAEGSTPCGDPAPSLYRFDGTSWTRCDPLGNEDRLPPDPACAGVAGLWRGGFPPTESNRHNYTSVRLLGAARVPLESDGDPANDDEFEVVAIGTHFRDPGADLERPAILRYRDGRWRYEDPAARAAVQLTIDSAGRPLASERLRAVAFTGPNDGWILGPDQRLFHFDGVRWVDCANAPTECGRPAERLGSAVTVNGLVAAGDRAYLYGSRLVNSASGTVTGSHKRTPVILERARGEAWSAHPEHGGYDPGFGKTDGTLVSQGDELGVVKQLAIAQRPDDRYEGWAIGGFGGLDLAGQLVETVARPAVNLLRLRPGEAWRPFADRGAFGDRFAPAAFSNRRIAAQAHLQAVSPDGSSASPAFIGAATTYGFNPRRERFEALPSGRPGRFDPNRGVDALAADGAGGFWQVVGGGFSTAGTSRPSFFHYTDRPRKPVFDEVANPLTQPTLRARALAAAPDGAVWTATNTNLVARYDRLTGWDTVRIPGWDPGQVVTNPSGANAVAVGPDGSGIVVGREGRIARIGPSEVRLDPAAGTLCDLKGPVAPCGTGRDLHAAAVGPDGSAIVGGIRLTLLWRPAGGEFRAVTKPPASLRSTVTGVSLPRPDRAFLATSIGEVWAGRLVGEDWVWDERPENLDPDANGELLGRNAHDQPGVLRAIAIRADLTGYAVGQRGTVLYREPDGSWRRLRTGFYDDLVSLALPAGGAGDGVLIGGRNGLVLTGVGDRIELARPADFLYQAPGALPDDSGVNDSLDIESNSGEVVGPTVGVALVPGIEDGQVEAWVAIRGRGDGTNQLLHYGSDPQEPLLSGNARAEPSADSPALRPGELSLAALGKSDCHMSETDNPCPEPQGTTSEYEVFARRIGDELAVRSARSRGPEFALFSGDAVDTAGVPVDQPEADLLARHNLGSHHIGSPHNLGLALATVVIRGSGAAKLRRWRETLADRIADRGLPFFAAVGPGDLSTDLRPCVLTLAVGYVCSPRSTKEDVRSGDNLAWREAMADQPAPWGKGDPLTQDPLRFKPVRRAPLTTRIEDPTTPDLDGPEGESEGHLSDEARVPIGGAATHYALDVVDESGGDSRKLVRLVFADSSLRSLAASDAIQNPLEPDGGQAAWLEKVLCRAPGRAPTGERCTRGPDQRAIVVSNAPTYTYAQIPPSELQADAAAFEAILLRHRVNLVVSGRLGWNGLYWATAPGLHEPCPGEGYRAQPPEAGTRVCGRSVDGLPLPALPVTAPLAGALADPALSEPLASTGGLAGQGVLPFVVASGAGGALVDENGESKDGFWHGYTVVRLDASGDPAGTIVEQRPVADWVTITGQERTLRPGQKMTLRGHWREPIAVESGLASAFGGEQRRFGRFRRIDSAAVTHRYELVEADPAKPWLPKQDAQGRYVPLDPTIATLDAQSGVIKVGKGNQARAFALGILSMGCSGTDADPETGRCDPELEGIHVASYPLVFESRRTFKPVVVATPRVAEIKARAQAALPQPPNPPQPPNVQNAPLPSPPNVPVPPAPAVPEVNAPTPPVPPPPPVQQSPVPLDLSASAPTLQIAPQTTVIPPPAPPIQPAPPGGARREARQRQSATQSSGSGSGEGSEIQHGGGDLANGPDSSQGNHAATRLDRTRADGGSMTAYYGASVTLLALVAAFGWNYGRPGPRRRSPVEPAPARAWTRRRF